MKNFVFYFIILVLCILCAIICWLPQEFDMSIPEFQQFLCDKGYPVKVDGELGNETEAQWRLYINNFRKGK